MIAPAPPCQVRVATAAYVRLLLKRLGFQPQQVQQIMNEIADAPRGAC